ncbi:terminase large subunit [Hyphomicrobium sulfonivorans]|uniref:terminase large subunit n=1 Tax=Hyphomicrobium sulfonivorans TaxID=121290 RepID=UPI000B1989B6|nr:terminase TerL endonuclease subunit [Hyphomicrobium sulfonivorans]
MPSGVGQGTPLKLIDFQKEFILNVYGPRNPSNRDLRRIRRALLSIARKNGKSALAAGLVLVHLVGPEAIPNGDVLSCATDRGQAALIYKMAKQMVELDPELSAMCKCLDSIKRIVCYHNGSFYQSLAADGRRNHGGNPVFCIYDELAQALDRELYDTMETAFGAQAEGLFLVISTQNNDPTHVMTELCDDAFAQRSGMYDDPYFYGIVYGTAETPDGFDVYDEANWYLSNPALGQFKVIDHMRALALKAKKSPSSEASFMSLDLNMRVDGTHRLVNSSDWRACQTPFSPDEMRGLKCYGGLDLSSRQDLTAFTLSWVQPDNVCVASRTWFWTHAHELEDREKKDGTRYREWAAADWLTILPGKSVSFKAVVQAIFEITKGHDLQAICFDRYRIDELKREMEYEDIEEDTFKLVEFGQGYKDMTGAVDALETRVIEHTLHHDGNPLLTYCLAGVKIMKDPAGNRKFDKSKSTRRIDGAVTLAMSLAAIAKAEKPEPPKKSPYLQRGLRVL